MTYSNRPDKKGSRDIVGRGVLLETTSGLSPQLRNGKVIQDPASATTFPTPNAIVMAYPDGTIDEGWLSVKVEGLEFLMGDYEDEDIEFLN